MRKYLSSLTAALIAVALIGAPSFAFESKSVKSENTFDFYENEFDFMLMPAKLAGQDSTLGDGHKLVEGFTGYRLFTNLTNQAGTNAYQIGGIIPIPGGMGNVGILFDYKKNEGIGPSLDCVNCGQAYLYQDLGDLDWNFEEEEYQDTYYDEYYDDLYTYFDGYYDDAEEEIFNFYLGYGLPIPGTPFSVGLSYAYGNIDANNQDGYRDASTHDNDVSTDPYGHADDYRWSDKDDYEYETHEISLEGRYNDAPVDSLFGFAWRTRDGENTSSYDYDEEYTAYDSLSPDYFYRETWMSRENGDNLFPFCGYGNLEGDRWSLYTENIFELNPTVAFGLDLAYRWGDYDDNLDYDYLYGYNERYEDTDYLWTDNEVYIEYGELDGSIDNDEFNVRGELRLTFPKVRFGLGVVYNNFQEDGDYSGDGGWSYTETKFEDTGISTTYNYYYEASATGEGEVTYSIEQETWRFPVSTEFNITERLVGRLGVEFVFGDWELEYTEGFVDNPDYSWYENNNGTITSGGDKDWSDAKNTYTDEDTFSDTIYNAGLGYQVAENLTVDAMWRHSNNDKQNGESIKREGVSTDDLYISATLAF